MKYFKYILQILLLQALMGTGLVQAAKIISSIQAIDLGVLPGGEDSSARDINDAGNIVGSSKVPTADTHAFFLPAGGVMQDIGTLPGGDTSQAYGINDLNQIVGGANLLNPITGDLVFHGFVWKDGTITDLGAFPPEDDINSQSRANAINNDGLIAGFVDAVGVVWDLAGTPDFPPFPPTVRIADPVTGAGAIGTTEDINNAGMAVGTVDNQGVRWQAGTLESLVPVAIALNNRNALGINERGEVVGVGLDDDFLVFDLRALYWPDPTTVLELGDLGGVRGEANDINNDGIIVGSSKTATGETEAFIWHADFGMKSLGTLGGANSKAFAINSSGQIVGESETESGELRATLWTVNFVPSIRLDIQIDIKPKRLFNPIYLSRRGVIPVAILGSASFNVSDVDVTSLVFGPNGAPPKHKKGGHTKDVNADGFVDIVTHYRTAATGIAMGDEDACVTGKLIDGASFLSCDSIMTVRKKGAGRFFNNHNIYYPNKQFHKKRHK